MSVNESDKKKDDVVLFKYYVLGKLIFNSPLVLGCGEESNSDKDIVRNWSGTVFLPSPGIVGPTRHYLDSILENDGDQEHELILQVFGEREKESTQSLISFYDGDQIKNCVIKTRDGVKIDYFTKIAEDKAKYNYETMEPNASCRFRVELTIRGNPDGNDKVNIANVENILYLILKGFKDSEIRLGAKNSRGFGEVELVDEKILKLNLSNKVERDKWVNFEWSNFNEGNLKLDDLPNLLEVFQKRNEIKIEFNIPYSVIIRAPNPDPEGEDVVHLSSNGKPIISGPTWNGALRNSIMQVARKINRLEKVKTMMEELFGYAKTAKKEPDYKKRAKKSRIYVEECSIKDYLLLEHTRNRIDAYTGGTIDTALFTESPSIGGKVELNLQLFDAKEYEIGLILLGIKELWHGIQPVGGGSNIGRGILEGLQIKIDDKDYNIEDIEINFNNEFEKYLTPLAGELNK